MKYLSIALPAAWLIVALLLIYYSYAGGDTAISAFLFFVFWTFPFGAIWSFNIYPLIPRSMLLNGINIIGDLVSVVLAFVFWFVLIPWVFRKARKLRRPNN